MMGRMRKFAVLVMALAVFALLCGVAGAESAGENKCGENLNWVLDDGKLTITGTGAMDDYTEGNPAPWYDSRESITLLEIGDGVQTVGNYAFYNCKNLQEANIPSSAASFGEYAFRYTALTSIDIPSNSPIRAFCFGDCKNLRNVTIPNGVDKIEACAFYASGLESVTIPDSVTRIGGSAFARCEKLTGVTVPKNVEEIGEGAFSGCTSLTGIGLDAGNTAFVLSDGALYDKDMTVLLAYPAGRTNTAFTVPDGVTRIGESVFHGCAALASVTIPGSVAEIGESAFWECGNLSEVTIGKGLKTIGRGAFGYCAGLKEVTIPDGVTVIDSMGFAQCTGLERISIPASVTSIGFRCFSNAGKLTVEAPCGSYAITWAGENNIPYREIHSLKGTAAVEPTCTAAGNSAYWTCETCGKYFSDEEGTAAIAKDSWIIPASHDLEHHAGQAATCTEAGWKAYDTCTRCEYTTYTTIAALGHQWGAPAYAWAKDNSAVTAKRACARDASHIQSEKADTTYKVTKKPTYTAAGVGTYTTQPFTNTAFKAQTKNVAIAALPRTSIKKATFKAIDPQVYTGGAIKPALSVKYNGKKLVKGTDYTVSFENNVKPGKATVTIKGRNAWKGSATMTFRILPKAVKLVSLKAGKKKIMATWKKGAAITGYEIEYSTKKDFSKAKTVTIADKATLTTKIKNLKPGKTYYVRIRAYKKVGSKMYCSEWSDSMKAKVPEE